MIDVIAPTPPSLALPQAPVEVYVSDRCQHECVEIFMGSASVWFFIGVPRLEAKPEQAFLIHHCETGCVCFDEDDDEDDAEEAAQRLYDEEDDAFD